MARGGGSAASLAGVAAGVVIGSAVLFALIGGLRGGDDTPEIADQPMASPTAVADDPAEEPAEPEEPTPTESAAAEEEPEAEPSESDEPAPDPEPSDEPTEAETAPAGTVDPGSVSIQVLDATGSGDRSAAEAVADELRAAGYRVVVVNSASKTYTATTVFWSSGQEAAGRQIAAEFSFPEVSATPEEVQLSDSVNVHVVVGTDRT